MDRDLRGAVLIVLESVRADHLSCYGYDRPTSPSLDSLASQGVQFTQVVSCAPWELPSVAALLSGDYPHRLFANKKMIHSIVRDFQQAGFSTAAVTEGGWISAKFGLDLGFDSFVEEEGAVQFLLPGEQRDPTLRGGIEKTFASARHWLSEHRDGKFFLLVHTYEPHVPHTKRDFASGMDPGSVPVVFTLEFLAELRRNGTVLSDNDLEYVKALYDGDILASDRQIGEFLSFLKEIGLGDRTLVVVTSDHGEELNDHYPSHTGGSGHSLRDPQLLVPLILFDPSRRYPVDEVSAQVRLLDVMPTIAEILEVPVAGPTDGRSLVPLMNGVESGSRPALVGYTSSGPSRIGLRAMGFKYIASAGPDTTKPQLTPAPPPRQLYDLARDPGERANLVEQKPELAKVFHETVWNQFASRPPAASGADRPEDVDAALEERLESLGYVTRSSPK